MKRRDLLKGGLALGLTLGSAQIAPAANEFPEASWNKLPRWRGFNLLEKFNGRNKPFVEDDFKWIRDFGFNFVRLPMDYRGWIRDNDWRRFDEKTLGEIDEAIRFGEKYGIHVNLNFHRAPGYTVARPAEPKSVWTDPEALEVCALHWRTFAKRYRGISSDRVSFNLFNEPDRVEKIMDRCVAAHRFIIKAIREEDPDRLIICDGYDWATRPFRELVDVKVAQASRGYKPIEISHYKASWVNGENFPSPVWPTISGNGLFFAPNKGGIKAEQKSPMLVSGYFPSQTTFRMRVGTVSGSTPFSVLADGKPIFEHHFKPGPGEGEWKKVVHRPEWNIYQNVYDRDYEAVIPAGTQKLELRATGGDWLTLMEIGFRSEKAGEETRIPLPAAWDSTPSTFRYQENDGLVVVSGGTERNSGWLKKEMEPWLEIQRQGVGVMVGEFGAFSFTPHDVVLRWMEDMLVNWKEAGWGYALWNFRGGFGILDSGRKDVAYEDFHGLKLDRKMLELLQKY